MERTTGIEELASALGISVESIRDVGHDKGIEAACQAVNLSPEDDLDVLVAKAIEAYLSASNQVLVPREASSDMMHAGVNQRNAKALFDLNDAYHVWRAMISAAPNLFKDK